MGQQEREKINRQNTLPAVRRTKGPSKSREELAGYRPAQPRRRRGSGEGKEAGSAPRTASPTILQTGLRFLPKDLLTFWMVDIRREGRGETQGARTRPAQAGTGAGDAEGRRRTAPDWRRRKLRLGPRRGEGARTRGECARQAPGCLSRLGREGTKCGRSRVRCCGSPEGWNCAQRRARSMESSREPEQRRGESSARPSPQRDGTSEPVIAFGIF